MHFLAISLNLQSHLDSPPMIHQLTLRVQAGSWGEHHAGAEGRGTAETGHRSSVRAAGGAGGASVAVPARRVEEDLVRVLHVALVLLAAGQDDLDRGSGKGISAGLFLGVVTFGARGIQRSGLVWLRTGRRQGTQARLMAVGSEAGEKMGELDS